MPTPRSVTTAFATTPFTRSAAARTTDPIFAAIKAHQAAWELAREASDDEIDALMAAEADRLAELLRMMPTTIAGCAAIMRWIETYSRDEANHSYLFYDWEDRLSEPGSTLLGRLAAAIERASE
jgi:DNA-binding GntR family transcriptional regulator